MSPMPVHMKDITLKHLDSDNKHFVTHVEVKSELRYTIKHIWNVWDTIHSHFWWSPDQRQPGGCTTDARTQAEHTLPLKARTPSLWANVASEVDSPITLSLHTFVNWFAPHCGWLIEHKNDSANSFRILLLLPFSTSVWFVLGNVD